MLYKGKSDVKIPYHIDCFVLFIDALSQIAVSWHTIYIDSVLNKGSLLHQACKLCVIYLISKL